MSVSMQSNNTLGLASLRGVFWCVGSTPACSGVHPADGLVMYGVIPRGIIYLVFVTHVLIVVVRRGCTWQYIPT